jgi:DNA-binding NarL/FixJ family response regulator
MPDVWGTIVLFINVLLLFAGWLLFQQAKSDLTARAAQIPVLSEVKALQKSVAALLEQLKLESIQTSAQLDTRCAEARDLLAAIDRKLEESARIPARPTRKRAGGTARAAAGPEVPPDPAETVGTAEAGRGDSDPRREQVYALTDEGVPAVEIARRTGISEGEIELLLGLRSKVH